MARKLTYYVPDEYDKCKLKIFLKDKIKISTRLLTKLKNDPQGLLCNGEHIRTVDIISKGDEITVNIPEEKGSIPISDCSQLSIIYEDEDIIIIDKPSGIAMHPSHNHQGDTLANMLAAYFDQKQKNVVFRAIGRLDKCTSGLVVCALNRHSAAVLSGKIKKEYIAIIEGELYDSGTIDKPIFRPYPDKTIRAVGEQGERAVTHWKSIVTDGNRSVLRINLETGRTHQIRVHFSSLGNPLVGDDMYGSLDRTIGRAALHCAVLDFLHPVNGEAMHFEKDLPYDMAAIRDDIYKNQRMN